MFKYNKVKLLTSLDQLKIPEGDEPNNAERSFGVDCNNIPITCYKIK